MSTNYNKKKIIFLTLTHSKLYLLEEFPIYCAELSKIVRFQTKIVCVRHNGSDFDIIILTVFNSFHLQNPLFDDLSS